MQFVVDSLQVQELAKQLASVKGDSLRTYWKRYWSKRVHKQTDTLFLESTDTLTVEQIDTLYRESIVQIEVCDAALDSNRSALADTKTSLEQCRKESESSFLTRAKWFGGGFITGRVSCLAF